jgi:hypothetical protein
MAILTAFPAGGGAKLNVTAYSAAGSLPASDKQGAIAVITSAAIGAAFASADAPASPSGGDVWVWLGGTSLAPAALNDKITLHPRAVYQRISGAWTLRTAYVYTGGAWVEITLSLYDNGSFLLAADCELILGDTLTKQSNAIYLIDGAGRGEVSYARAFFTNAVDLTNVSTVKVVADWSTSGTSASKFFRLEIGTGKPGTVVAYATVAANGTNMTVSVDVSALNGSYYVGVFGYGPPSQTDSYPSNLVYVHQCYLEK